MSRPHASSPLPLLIAFACALALPASAAKKSEWDLPTGKFKGEPVELVGPLALFRTGAVAGWFSALGGWKPEDYRRFAAETASHPPRVARWSDAKGAATSEFPGHASRVENNQLVPVDFTKLPEPELLLVLYGSHNDGESWMMVRELGVTFQHIQHVYPGRVAGLFYGVRHNATEHARIATSTWMPWLVANYRDQSSFSLLSRFAPKEGPALLLISRDGVPLLGASVTDLHSVHEFVDKLTRLVALTDSTKPHAWKGLAEYRRLLRADPKSGNLPPDLIGTPLRPDVLRKYGAERIDAHLQVAADGTISAVAFLPSCVMPAELEPALREVLAHQAIVLPAVVDGHPVAGEVDYHLVVPPANRERDAEAAWFGGEAVRDVPIPSWLLLRPIHVTEQDFGDDHVDANGTVVRKTFTVVNDGVTRASQMSAFHTDWFTEAGAASVHPNEGDSVEIDGSHLRWQRAKPDSGFVDFRSGPASMDYCIGYAWTEIEVPADTDAWLGLGSDDGVKIWLNGELVNDKWVRRMSSLDDDIVPLRLRKGKNQFLIKIQNANGDWSFICRLRTRN